MMAGSPAWDDEPGLIAWINANEDSLAERPGKLRSFDEAAEESPMLENADYAQAEAFFIELTFAEKEALLLALEKGQRSSLAGVLRSGECSAAFLGILADAIDAGALHYRANTGRRQATVRRSPFATRRLVYLYRMGLRELFPEKDRGVITGKAHKLVAGIMDCSESQVARTMDKPNEDRRAASEALLLRVRLASVRT